MSIRFNTHLTTIVLLISLLITSTAATAQGVIDDDFLDVIEKNAQPLIAASNTYFNTTTVPSKYNNESAIIFGFKRELTIDKKSKAGFFTKGEKSLLFYENTRFKIKLQDRNAVKAFTECYFRYSDKEDGFIAKVTKKDGLVTTVNLSDAVRVERVSEVPEFFKSFFDQEVNSSNRYYKVAIPDLERNDVLEYVSITKSKLDVRGNGLIEFSPQYELCAKKYPILYNQISIETDSKSYFKALSKNGAPEFKQEAASNSDFYRYVFTDYDRAVNKDVNFVNTYRQFPFTKFQVIYSNSSNAKGVLIGNTGEIKKQFTKQELALKAWEDYSTTGDNYMGNAKVDAYVTSLNQNLKKLGSKDWTNEEHIKYAYYRLRNYVLNRDSYISDKYFAYLFTALLAPKKITTELIISVPNYIGTMQDVLFEQELRFVVKVGNNLYFNCTDHSNLTELVESLLNSEAYIITEPQGRSNAQAITPYTLPDLPAASNTANIILNTTLQPSTNTLLINRVSTYRGIQKNKNISDALKYTLYFVDDYKNYNGSNPADDLKSKQLTEYEESIKAIKAEYKEAKPLHVKNEIENEYERKVKVNAFSIQSDGRSLKRQDLTYTEDFELQNMVRKAGKKLLVNLSGLVGSQLQIKPEQRTRNNDIDVDYARELNWTINFAIPAGFTIDGLTELNTTVDNEIGTFTCTATQANNMAVITIKKVYKKATFDKAKWNLLLQFVDAAYNASFKNVLLKPKD